MTTSTVLSTPLGRSNGYGILNISLDDFQKTLLKIGNEMLDHQKQFFKDKYDVEFPKFKDTLPSISIESLLGMLRCMSTLELDHRVVLMRYSIAIENEIMRRCEYYDRTLVVAK